VRHRVGRDSHFAQKFRSANPVSCSTLGLSGRHGPQCRSMPTNTSILMTQNITIVGVGLIGGSFALALREAGHDAHFIGVGRNEQSLQRAVELGIVDSYRTSLADAVRESDLVLLATPVGAIDSVLEQMAPALGSSTIITDAGSVKQSVIESARKRLQHFENFVPAHPIAGTEHSGVEAGFASLYQGKRLILTCIVWMKNHRCFIMRVAALQTTQESHRVIR